MSESTLDLKMGKQKTDQSASKQQESLFETKLSIPSTRLKQVDRSRLIEGLNHGLQIGLWIAQ